MDDQEHIKTEHKTKLLIDRTMGEIKWRNVVSNSPTYCEDIGKEPCVKVAQMVRTEEQQP